MAAIASNLNAAFLSVGKTIKTSSGSAVNIAICLVTMGSEQLFSFATFDCPCPKQISNNLSEIENPELIGKSMIYGIVYIVVPAIILFFLGYAMNIKTWKLVTGCGKRDIGAARGYSAGCKTLLEIFMQALVAPSAWISIAFLDGKYYACAQTKQPYVLSCDVMAKAVKKVVLYTTEFERQRQTSQVIGWVFIAIVVLVGSLIYMVYRIMSPLTYYHRKYMKWYREIEHKEFEEIAKEQLKEQARENIKRFLSCKRPKHPWDCISTVYTFKRDEEGFAIYSRLDEWNDINPTSSEDECKSEDEESNKSSSVEDIQSVLPVKEESKTRQKSSKFASVVNIAMDNLQQQRLRINSNEALSFDEAYYESSTKYATCRANQQCLKEKSVLKNKNKVNSDSRNKFSNESSAKLPLLSTDPINNETEDNEEDTTC